MFIYNITIKVNRPISDQWMKWQMEEHIPDIMATELFNDYKVYRLHDQDDSESLTFIFQFHTSDRNNYDQYIKEHAPRLREKTFQKWRDGFIAFRSLLETVQ